MENVENMENFNAEAQSRREVGGDPRAPRDGWRKVRLGEICSHVCSGGTPKSGNSAFYDGGDIPWLNTKEVNFEDVYTTEKFITQEGYDNSAAKWVEPNSVIIAMYGATAGKSCITKIRLTTNQACCNMQIDDAKADYRFVFYMVRSHYEKLASLAVGGAQQNLSAQFLKDYSISLPPLPIQQRIAEILGAYDDAIENNRRRIALLEKMARELYRERFVRRAGKMLRKSATDWFGEITIGKTPPRKEAEHFNGDVPWVSISDMGREGMFVFDTAEHLARESVERLHVKVVPAHTLLLSFKLTVGRLAITTCECCTNEAIAHLNVGERLLPYVYLNLANYQYAKLGNTCAISDGINSKIVKAMPIDIPSYEEIDSFNKVALPMFDEMLQLALQNRNLARQRDKLLPRLLSGKLDVSKLVKEGV